MQYRYLIFHEDYTITGTDSEDQAKLAREWAIVVDAEEGTVLDLNGESREIKSVVDYLKDNPPDLTSIDSDDL